MVLDLLLFLGGVALAWLTLRDVFETVVVPGGSRASLKVAQRLGAVLLPIWKLVRGRRRGVSGTFAPVVLVGTFVVWISLLDLAFGLMAYAAAGRFDPPLRSFFDAAYMVGSSIVTIGMSEENALGIGRWIILAAGFCGLAVMTMAVTYLLQVQTSISQRDTGIIKLNTSAGDPPSALTLLERFAAIHNRDELRGVLIEGRNWCATVRQSHSAHPTLIYFQSIGVGAGWPAALGAILDVALVAEHLIEDDSLFGPAVLLRDEGLRMARDLSFTTGVDPKEVTTSEAEFKQVANRLVTSGYAVRAKADLSAMGNQRSQYLAYVDAIADHLGKPRAVLIRQS